MVEGGTGRNGAVAASTLGGGGGETHHPYPGKRSVRSLRRNPRPAPPPRRNEPAARRTGPEPRSPGGTRVEPFGWGAAAAQRLSDPPTRTAGGRAPGLREDPATRSG